MAYSINLTNGNLLVTLADGEINTANSSITLIGRNVATYGESLNENIVHMLENFAQGTAPTAPLEGQLWMDTGNQQIKVRINNQWVGLSSYVKSASQPMGLTGGDLWYDTTTGQVKVRQGSEYRVIGPTNALGLGNTQIRAEFITDLALVDHEVLSVYVQNVRLAVISVDPQFSTAVAGFATVKPGITLNSTVTGAVFQVTANNAQALNNLTSDQFMRSDQDTATTGNITVLGEIAASVVSGDFTGNGAGISNLTGANVVGEVASANTATTASGLTAARNIALTGNVVGNVNFTGTGNVSMNTSLSPERLATTGGTLTGALLAQDGIRVSTTIANLISALGDQVGICTGNPQVALDVAGAIRMIPVVSGSSSGNISLDAQHGNHQVVLSGSANFTFSNFNQPGQVLRLVVVGTEHSLTWPSDVYWPYGAAPDFSTGVKKIAVITLTRANTITPDPTRPDANFILATYVSF